MALNIIYFVCKTTNRNGVGNYNYTLFVPFCVGVIYFHRYLNKLMFCRQYLVFKRRLLFIRFTYTYIYTFIPYSSIFLYIITFQVTIDGIKP